MLAGLPDLTWDWEVPEVLAPVIHLFTDGAARYPSEPRVRVATWSVVVGDIEADQFTPIARGVVHGLLQTVLRGEILGALSALRFLATTDKEAILWVDNLEVSRKIELYRQGWVDVSELDTNHDLWMQLRDATRTVRHQLIKCVKVPSHEDHSQYSAMVEAWVIRGNAAADNEATCAFDDLPHEFQRCWERRVVEHEQQTYAKKVLHDHFCTIGRRAVAKGSTHKAGPTDEDHEISQDEHQETVAEAIPVLFPVLPIWSEGSGCDKLGPCGPEFHDWLTTLQTQTDSFPEWVTAYQLLVSYQLTTGHLGPTQIHKKWHRSEDFWINGVGYSFLDQSRWMVNFFKHYGRCFGSNILSHFRRPTCTEKIVVWARCYHLKVSRTMLRDVDAVFHKQQSAPITKMRRDLINFPMVSGR